MPIQLSGSGSITGVSTFSGPITSLDVSGNVSVGGTLTYDDVTSIDSVGVVTARAGVEVPDNQKAIFGTGDDLQIHHSNNNSFVTHTGPGQLFITNETSGQDINFRADNGGSLATYMLIDSSAGEVKLNHAGSLKLATKSFGVDITGELECDSVDVSGGIELDGELNFMGGEGHKYIDCNLGSGALNIRGTSGGDANHRYLAKFVRNGPVELYHNNVQKFETTSSGIKVSSSFPDIVIHDTDTTNDNFRILHNGGGTQLQVDPNNVGPNASHFIIGIDGTERLRMESGGTVKFAANNSSTDYLEWGNNPRLVLQAPSGLNGLRIYSDTTPLEVAGGASTRKISVGGGPNHDISISGDYSLSSGGHDSSPKVFLNATRHNGSGTVTSFQTSIQAVSVSNTAGDGYLGLGASASPDDLIIRPNGNIYLGGYLESTTNNNTVKRIVVAPYNWTGGSTAEIASIEMGAPGSGSDDGNIVLKTAENVNTGGTLDERFRVSSNGKIHIGYDASNNAGTDQVNIVAAGSGLQIARNQASAPSQNDWLGAIGFQGYLSSNSTSSADALIHAKAAAHHSGTTAPTHLIFSVKPAGTGPGSAPTERLKISSNGEIISGNISINAFANENTPSGYSQFQSDNHANTLFAQNLKLGTSGGSGNHNIEIINQHATVGGAGMYMGGNGSNQQNAINFYAEAANQSAGTDVTANRRAQINSSSFFTWVEPRNQSSNAQSYIRTFGFTFNLQDGETETLFYNPDGYRRIYYEMYVQSGHGSNGYGYILGNISRYGSQIHDSDWHVSYTSYAHSGSVNGNVNHNGIKFTRSGYSNTNITYYVIVKCWSPAGGTPYSNSGLTDPSYRYFTQGY